MPFPLQVFMDDHGPYVRGQEDQKLYLVVQTTTISGDNSELLHASELLQAAQAVVDDWDEDVENYTPNVERLRRAIQGL